MEGDFELFQKEFKKWQIKFGLTGYKVYFKHEAIDGAFANITVNQTDMVAAVKLNSDTDKESEPFKDIKRHAKHEAIHLLVNRLEAYASDRFVSQIEITEATEELVFRLEDLISDKGVRE